MSEHKPRLVRAERRAVLYEECSHDEATTELTEDHRSFGVIIDRGGVDVRYNDWLDTQENRDYVANSNGELYYCRVAEVRGPGVGEPPTAVEPPVYHVPPTFTFVNFDGGEVRVGPGDRIEVLQTEECQVYVRKVAP